MSSIFVWAFFMPLLYRIGGCRSVIVLPVGVKSLL
nr:MAG TPA: hypothetical protein [Caudoviricetes sp.]